MSKDLNDSQITKNLIIFFLVVAIVTVGLAYLGIYIQDAIDVNRWHFTLGSRYDQLNFDVSDLDFDDGNQSGKNKFSELSIG